MLLTSLITQSRRHYRRFYRLVALAVILMMAVLSGSLLLGDSVRGTLVQRVTERLGATETIIASGTGFLSEDIMRQPLLADAQGCLLVDGYVSVDDKLIPVYVWGVDADSLSYGEALVNEPLGQKLANLALAGSSATGNGEAVIGDLVLHLPSHNLVPSGTLFVTQSYATQMRLHVVGKKSVEEGGNLLLKNEQTLPLNVFVDRQQLAETLELEGKINLILSDQRIEKEQLADAWKPELSGIRIDGTSLTYDGIFIPSEVVEKASSTSQEAEYTLYFSYLVNDLIHNTDTVPYSFVTAVTKWQGERLSGRDIILSDYAAQRLHVMVGDSVRMSYFLAKDIKNLDTREQTFRIKDIVPLSDFMRDSLLTAEFPGLSNVERCADWDSDLPIQMNRVHKVDEDFWYAYRQTPKAIVAYDAVKDDWANAFGSATAIRFSSQSGQRQTMPAVRHRDDSVSPSSTLSLSLSSSSSLSSTSTPSSSSTSTSSSTSSSTLSLSLEDVGILLIHPRAEGLNAASNGVDFASLFLALGAFIIMAAIMLMASPLQEMFAQRRSELQLYQQLGFKQKRISLTLFREAFTLMLLASPLGILAGVAYSGITLWLLGNVWSGATHTEGFVLYIQPLTLVMAWVVGLILCAIILWLILRNLLKEGSMTSIRKAERLQSHPAPSASGGQRSENGGFSKESGKIARQWILFATLLVATLTLIAVNFIWLHSMMVFIVCGLLWVIVFGLFLRTWVLYKVAAYSRSGSSGLVRPAFSRTQLSWHAIRASLRQHLLAYWALALGVFTVFAVGLNRPDFSDAEQQAGGYQLYVESRVPIQYDLNNAAVRRKLSLTDLPEGTHFLQFMRHTQDEASCLNLNKVSTPTVLARVPQTCETAPPTPEGEKGWLDEIMADESTVLTPPRGLGGLFLDQESLIWSIMKSVGDTLTYLDGRGNTVPVVIAGSYPTGIFHGNALMSSQDFRSLWPRESGTEVLLVQSSAPEQAAELLATALSEYGLTIQTVEERIQMFFEVTETYLIIFLTLGALGLLLGIFSLIIVVRKNLTAQHSTIQQYRSMGFQEAVIQHLLLRENLIVPFFAIGVGVTGSFISISANVGGAGLAAFLSALVLLLVLCLFVYFGVRHIIRRTL